MVVRPIDADFKTYGDLIGEVDTAILKDVIGRTPGVSRGDFIIPLTTSAVRQYSPVALPSPRRW